MKKVIITGATGMVGGEVLETCLRIVEIEEVIIFGRKESNLAHPKLQQVVVPDFLDLSKYQDELVGVHAAFYCIGAYTGQVSDDQLKAITIDYPVTFANELMRHSPQATFCFLSGAGADRSEKSRMAFARYKGIAENKLSNLALGSFYSFRPGYIYPVKKRKEPSFLYALARFLYPILSRLSPASSITSLALAQAMVKIGLTSHPHEVLENKDILDITIEELRA